MHNIHKCNIIQFQVVDNKLLHILQGLMRLRGLHFSEKYESQDIQKYYGKRIVDAVDKLYSRSRSSNCQDRMIIQESQTVFSSWRLPEAKIYHDAMTWKTKFINTHTFTREMLEKLIQKVPELGGVTSGHPKAIPPAKDLPPPLDPKHFQDVQFWTAKSFEAYCKNLVGKTDGLATRHKKHGRCLKEDEDADRYPYLETVDGISVAWEILVKVRQKACQLWQALNTADLAPASWERPARWHIVTLMVLRGKLENQPMGYKSICIMEAQSSQGS
ncbi:hypothetical protein L208DRAFT_1374369 [Tricholoma matsutake]|nr:hypothetical protein L208DRAFT_1374369 [Tricholoma matsutake 945]